ncbi:MAG: chemotaxis protein CheA, partial [Desulfovibrionales bacterium]|nr:chemotaxis protein CheA [Desulfovibrionales bacterium]
MMMDDETLHMYVEEATEHLGDIENDLLTIEQTGADIDEELVNKVFRAAHSIKGGAGFLGLTKIKELGHKIENVLDMVRNRELVPEPEVVNIVLLAFDKLRELILNTAESNEMFIDDHIAALTGVASGHLQGAEKSSVDRSVDIKAPSGRTVFTVPEFDLLQNRKGGKNLYLLEFDLIHDVHGKNKKPLDVLKSMDASGVILDLKVDIEAVGTLEDEGFSNRIPLFVLFGSIIEEDIMPALLDLDSAFITLLNFDQLAEAQESAQPAAATAEPAVPAVSEEVVAKPQEPAAPAALLQDAPAASAPPAPPSPAPVKTVAKQPSPDEPKTDLKTTNPAIVQPDSLRVHVSLLEDLMTLAGELVLSRNQLMQAISSNAIHQIEVAGQRIDLVTSELQETIMLTRMQTIGNIFNKFPRVVRDLARSLGKEIDLQLEGNDVELDKTIIEGLGDPLTHLVRNSADHGIETPDERVAAGKQTLGTIVLKAYHEAGQVIIEIVDDGRGLDTERILQKALDKGLVTAEQAKSMSAKEKAHLIFLPGLSTADKITDVSGRGVGMDVVKSNLDLLGGQVDIETVRGKGTTIRIKLPLTLAIIPSLLVSVGAERYAIPQVNVDELLRIPAEHIRERLEMVGDAEVLLLRGELIPLLYLSTVLG